MFDSGSSHPLPQASLLDEVLFKPPNLLIQEVVGLVNLADCDVGQRGCRAVIEE